MCADSDEWARTNGTSRQVVNGSASFSGCSINVGSASSYTLVATASSGATQPRSPSPAMNVVDFQCPYGTFATSRVPSSDRPCVRAMFVFTLHSSRKINFSGARPACSTSSRSRPRG